MALNKSIWCDFLFEAQLNNLIKMFSKYLIIMKQLFVNYSRNNKSFDFCFQFSQGGLMITIIFWSVIWFSVAIFLFKPIDSENDLCLWQNACKRMQLHSGIHVPILPKIMANRLRLSFKGNYVPKVSDMDKSNQPSKIYYIKCTKFS